MSYELSDVLLHPNFYGYFQAGTYLNCEHPVSLLGDAVFEKTILAFKVLLMVVRPIEMKNPGEVSQILRT